MRCAYQPFQYASLVRTVSFGAVIARWPRPGQGSAPAGQWRQVPGPPTRGSQRHVIWRAAQAIASTAPRAKNSGQVVLAALLERLLYGSAPECDKQRDGQVVGSCLRLCDGDLVIDLDLASAYQALQRPALSPATSTIASRSGSNTKSSRTSAWPGTGGRSSLRLWILLPWMTLSAVSGASLHKARNQSLTGSRSKISQRTSSL